MENDQNLSDSPDESSPESPAVEASEDKDEDSNADSVDSPEREEYEDHSENGNTKNFEFSNRNSPDGTSAMEGELDFEDEVREEKDDILKESLDEDSQKENADQQKESQDDVATEELKSTLSDGEEEEEDGQVSANEQPTKGDRGEDSIEEGEDDGELSDEDDLEEGEVKDSSPTAKTQTRQVCRFFNRGQCTWGTLCRFLHLSVNDRGNYNMFAPSAKMMPPYGLPGNGPMGPRGGPRGGQDYHLPPPPPPLPIPPVPVSDPAPLESAWERGLRHAKELIKKSTRRKEQEPDFEEKRLNLSLSNEDNDREASEFDKENDLYAKPHHRRQNEAFKYDETDDVFDNGEREAREQWRGGRYENFEIRWTRQDMNKDRRQEKDRPRNARFSTEREKSKQWRQSGSGNKWRDERISEIHATRARADEWRDPWRRSKTPKGRRSRSRGRSRGSYSSVSSRSYSERSSRSSYSYSRSTSRSTFYSSRSPSPSKSSVKRKNSPRKETVAAVKAPTRSSPYKRKPIVLRRTLSRSYTRSRSSHSLTHSRSTSSRSLTRTPSVSRSRSRSYSRSLSMDSVSSASSSISRSSSRSGSAKNRNAHVSVLRREEVKPPPPKVEPQPKPATSSLFEEMQRLKQYDKMRETQKAMSAAPKKTVPAAPAPLKEKKTEPMQLPVPPVPPPVDNAVKEAPKQPQHKQQIKLTLLNKALPSKIPNPLKKELEQPKPKLPEKDEKPQSKVATKRPVSPTNVKPAVSAKRSTSSRRDELLKQLKAVEDAIARKRAKFS